LSKKFFWLFTDCMLHLHPEGNSMMARQAIGAYLKMAP